jgi:hypothetical protein
VVRTRIREDQEQDVSFVSEGELNEFFTSVVITGTEDSTSVIQNFKTFFPGQGLIVVTDGLTVTTGTQLVTISGFKNEFVSASGSLQSQIQVAGGVTSITASGITVSGALTFAGLSGITLIPDFNTNTITFSGSGVTSIVTVSGIEGDITILGAGEVDVITEGNTIVISGTPHTPVPNAIIGAGQVVVTSGSNITTISGQPSVGNALIGGANVTIVSGTSTTTISSVNDVSDALVGIRGIVVNSGTDTTTLDFVPTALVGVQGVTVTSGSNTITIGHVPKALVSDNFASVISGTNVDTIVHKAIISGQGSIVVTGTNAVTINTFDETDVDSITTSGVTFTGSVNLNSDGGIRLVPGGGNTITVSGGSTVGQLVGNFFQVEFTAGGNVANTWLAVSDAALPSNITPWVVSFPCRLAGIFFSNANANVDQDVEIYAANAGAGNAETLRYTWQVRNARVSYDTNISAGALILNPGDKVGVFVRDQGDNAKDVCVGLYVEITQRTLAAATENYAGNF